MNQFMINWMILTNLGQFYIFAGESSDDLIWCNGCGATICQRCLPGGDLFSEKDREAYEFYPETVELEHCPFC